jgi:Tesmin/TSO1-like CXC domain, cysteine-rich domain/F-box-like
MHFTPALSPHSAAQLQTMASLCHQKDQLDEDLHTTDCTHSSGNTSSSSVEDGFPAAAATAGSARPVPSTPVRKGRIAELNGSRSSSSSGHTPLVGATAGSSTELDAVQALMDLPSSPFRSPMRETTSIMSPAPSTFTRSPWWSPVPSPFAGFASALSPILHSSAYCVSGAARTAAQPPLLSERSTHASSSIGIMSSPAAVAMRRSYMNSISSPLSSASGGLLHTPHRHSGGVVHTPGSAFMHLADGFADEDHEMSSIISLAMMNTPDSARRTRRLQQKLFPDTSSDGFDSSGLLSSPGGLTSALSWPVERHISNCFNDSNGFSPASATPPEQRQRMLSASDIHPGCTGLLVAAAAKAAPTAATEQYYSPVASRLTRRAATRTSAVANYQHQQQQQQQLYEERLAQQYAAPLTSGNDTSSKSWTCEHYGDTDDEAESSLNDLSTVLYRSSTKGKGRRKLSMPTVAAAVQPTPARARASSIGEQLSVSAQKRRKRATNNSTPIINTSEEREPATATASGSVQNTFGAGVSGSLRVDAMRRSSLAAASAVAAAGGDTTDADTTFERDDDDDEYTTSSTTATGTAAKKTFETSTQQQQQQQQQLQCFTSPLTSVGIREATMTVHKHRSNSTGSPQHSNISALLQDSAMHTTPITNRTLLQPGQYTGNGITSSSSMNGAFSSPATASASVKHNSAAMMSVERSGRSSSISNNTTDDDESPMSYRRQIRSSSSASADSPVVCNCKKSKCLKLYCDCFATSATCSSACNCVACENNTEHDGVRQEARRAILDRNPAAFQLKASDDTSSGCSCKKSSCLKKYCECYRLGNCCTTDRCRCVTCKNLEGGECDLKRKSYANTINNSVNSSSGNIIATALSSVMDICGVDGDYTVYRPQPLQSSSSVYSVAAVALEAAAAAADGNGTTGMTPAFTSKLNMYDTDDTSNGDSAQQHTNNNLRSPLVSAAMDYSEANNDTDAMQIDEIAIVPAVAVAVNNKKKGKSKKTTANTTTAKATTKASTTKSATATAAATVVAVKDSKIRAFGRGSRSLPKSNVMSIMQHLDNDDLYNACLVSKMWANLALDDVLWQY